MKFVHISILFSILFLGIFSQSYAENTEMYDLVVPQAFSHYQNNGFIDISGIGSNSGMIIVKSQEQSHSGILLCIAPKKNGMIVQSKIVASFPGRNPIWYGNIFSTRYEGERVIYPWSSMIFGKINGTNELGQIFSYTSKTGYGANRTCSFSENLIPESTTKTLTYNIRIQFPENTKLEFNKRVQGKKTWILKRQDNHQDTTINFSSFPDYGTNSEWKVTTVNSKKLDGINIDLIKEYRELQTASEGFFIPKDTEILSVTFTRK